MYRLTERELSVSGNTIKISLFNLVRIRPYQYQAFWMLEQMKKKAWNNVHTTVLISNGRTIAISLADKDTQSHFMGQQIYGIVKRLNIH